MDKFHRIKVTLLVEKKDGDNIDEVATVIGGALAYSTAKEAIEEAVVKPIGPREIRFTTVAPIVW